MSNQKYKFVEMPEKGKFGKWVTEDGSYVTDDFVSYVRPLIQGDVSPVMVDGIPRHLYRKN